VGRSGEQSARLAQLRYGLSSGSPRTTTQYSAFCVPLCGRRRSAADSRRGCALFRRPRCRNRGRQGGETWLYFPQLRDLRMTEKHSRLGLWRGAQRVRRESLPGAMTDRIALLRFSIHAASHFTFSALGYACASAAIRSSTLFLALDVLLIQRAVKLSSSRIWGSDGTEPHVDEVGGRGVAVAKRRPAVARVVPVAAAPIHPVVA